MGSSPGSDGYAVTRAHHSDVGGMRPGSMPSDSREIYQEGLRNVTAGANPTSPEP